MNYEQARSFLDAYSQSEFTPIFDKYGKEWLTLIESARKDVSDPYGERGNIVKMWATGERHVYEYTLIEMCRMVRANESYFPKNNAEAVSDYFKVIIDVAIQDRHDAFTEMLHAKGDKVAEYWGRS